MLFHPIINDILEKILSKKVLKVLRKKYILFIFDLLNIYKNVSLFNKNLYLRILLLQKKKEMLKLFILIFVLKKKYCTLHVKFLNKHFIYYNNTIILNI